MYTFIAIVITAAMIALTVLGARCKKVSDLKKYLLVNLVIGTVSLLGGILTPIITHSVITGSGSSAEWQGWAWDAFLLYVKTSLPLLGISLALICLTTLITSAVGKRHLLFSKVVRQSASLVVSAVLLFIAPFYATMAETDQAALHIFILIFAVCEALFMRCTFVLELAVRIRKKDAK